MAAKKRPDRTTMPGMIWNANHVLDLALNPESNGVPKQLFEKDIKGVALMSTIEAGFIFSGNVGTGILLARDENGKWSAPSALGLGGVGWGFIVGASIKDIIVFIFDEGTVSAMAGDTGLKFGGQGELTGGPFGRTAELSLNASNTGLGATCSVAFTKGFFGGISLEGAVVGPRSAVNEQFYGASASPSQIVFEGVVTVPDGTLIKEVYEKLDKLIEGATHEPSEAELEKVESARLVAEEAGAEAQKSEEVVKVDAAEEAAKEASA